ncbi:hypothetical protein BIWAKO_04938 [Bosea sp. BIWAKO-01]|nr:hypothetical protein BIWAKO_04938 [Bosea sp. BIWAKO-01]
MKQDCISYIRIGKRDVEVLRRNGAISPRALHDGRGHAL